jgi:hypothetical protein
MRSNEFHPNNASLILDLNYQSVLVATDIEYDAVPRTKTGVNKISLDVLRRTPLCFGRFVIPALQRATRTRATGRFPEPLKGAFGNDPHNQNLPLWEGRQVA